MINNPTTIVFWSDGIKTVVKCVEHDKFDAELSREELLRILKGIGLD